MFSFDRFGGFRRPRPLTCLGDMRELSGPRETWSSFEHAMPDGLAQLQLGRKRWEWDYISAAVDALDLGGTALGLGCGYEPLIFHFANRFDRVIATDLYSAETDWAEAKFASVEQVMSSSPIAFPRDRVEVANRDMRDTGVPDGSVDVVWSCSSIEHVPTLGDVHDVLGEVHRVLRPGGVAILTTEYSLTGRPYLLPGVNGPDEATFKALIAMMDGFEAIGPTDLSVNPYVVENSGRPRRYAMLWQYAPMHPHQHASMISVAGLSAMIPVAFALRKGPSGGVGRWQDLALAPCYRAFSDGVRQFQAGALVDADRSFCDALDAAGDDIQLRHHAWRMLIDVRANRGLREDRAGFHADLDAFLAILPDGPLQDSDCLDLLAYLLGDESRHSDAAEVYARCLQSPSIAFEHIFQIVERFLLAGRDAGRLGWAVETAVAVVSDLASFGYPPDVLRGKLVPAGAERSRALTMAHVLPHLG